MQGWVGLGGSTHLELGGEGVVQPRRLCVTRATQADSGSGDEGGDDEGGEESGEEEPQSDPEIEVEVEEDTAFVSEDKS